MEFVGETADGLAVRYIDRKRYLWLLSLTGGFNPPIAIALDHHNPPEEVVRHMARDNYYRTLLYVGIVFNVDPDSRERLHAKFATL